MTECLLPRLGSFRLEMLLVSVGKKKGLVSGKKALLCFPLLYKLQECAQPRISVYLFSYYPWKLDKITLFTAPQGFRLVFYSWQLYTKPSSRSAPEFFCTGTGFGRQCPVCAWSHLEDIQPLKYLFTP